MLGGLDLIRWVLTRSLRDSPVGLKEVSYHVVRRPHWLRPKGGLEEMRATFQLSARKKTSDV